MDDPLGQQIGAGTKGLRPGDFIFLFGGAIVRNEQASINAASIYGSLAVVTSDDDPLGPRVFPPYRGEAGAGNGGPLMTVLGQDIDLFFHPTAVRPGDILHIGDTLSIAGQLGPTLPSLVNVQITSPDGNTRTFSGRANAIGYFYDPANDFTVDQAGVWSVQIRAQHEGMTSAGKIEPPPPTGNIPGTNGGRFWVYVLPENTESLNWNGDTQTTISIPPISPYNLRFPLGEGWTNAQVYHTITIPGYVIEDGPLRLTGATFTYQYNLKNLSKNFPMLESDGQNQGPTAADVITLTFVVTGTDGDGRLRMSSRTFTVMYDRLMTFS
jgi:hypothetical protein